MIRLLQTFSEKSSETKTHTHTHTSPVHYAYIYSYSYHLVYQYSGYRRSSEPEKYTVYVPTLPSDFTRRYFTSIQTNKQRRKEAKKTTAAVANRYTFATPRLLQQARNALACPRSCAGAKATNVTLHICTFCEKQKSQQYLTYLLPLSLPLSFSLRWGHLIHTLFLKPPGHSSPVQFSPKGCYCGQAKAETTIIMTIFIIIHYHYNSSSQNRTEQNRTSIETYTPPRPPSLLRATADSVSLPRYIGNMYVLDVLQ